MDNLKEQEYEEKKKAYKRAMPNKEREEGTKLERRARMVRAAMDVGYYLRKDICKVTEMKLHELRGVLAKDKKLYAEYKVRKRSVMDMASDNIYDIVSDPNHPKNYDASKYMLTQFKSEYDEILDGKDGDDMSVSVNDAGMGNGFKITFSKKKEDKEDGRV